MRMRVQQLRLWLPAIAWALLILTFSGDRGASPVTERPVRGVAGRFGEDAVFYINYGLRKAVHVAAYGILAALNFRGVRGLRGGWRLRWSVAAVLLALLVACLDEWQQTRSALRTPAVADIGFDLCGAMLSQLLFRRGK